MNQTHPQTSLLVRRALPVLAVVAALLFTPLSLSAQRLPADNELRAFEASSDYELEIDGEAPAKYKLYFSQRAAAYLVMKAFDAPILLRQRRGSVEQVHIMKVSKQQDGRIDLLQGAVVSSIGRFQVDGDKINFTVDGKKAVMIPKPPLIGKRGADELLDHSPEYGVKAARYQPTSATLASLKGQSKNVEVKVYFGSWCSVCKRYLPYGIKLDQSLDSSKVKFEYYGIETPPKGWTDPEVKKARVQSLPTAVVFVNGKEAGRITGNSWQRPEAALDRIVKGAG